MTGYFDHLAERLRGQGIPEDQVAETLDDLTTYLSENGGDPEVEFGPVSEFAAQLVPPPAGNGGDGPAGRAGRAGRVRRVDQAGPANPPDGEVWRWRAAAFNELRWLETFGDQGWEVERVDTAGRFVCRRDAQDPQQWAYRRELVSRKNLQADTAALEDQLAPDDWEPCGTWVCYAYFKRSKAALIGPKAMIDAPERQPGRKSFYSRRFYLFLIALLAPVAVAVAVLMAVGDRYAGGNFATGALIGAIVAGIGLVVLCGLLIRRAEARADRE
ncbi:hypothetical protein [Actinopolymorpha alba]|uniref:hypothetical protein n=1 Tax=Actinopolymorpha alba TaxID=533267 RepID=UPI00035D5D96|nr:hypothetical protein [Actinopolymorpha alba]